MTRRRTNRRRHPSPSGPTQRACTVTQRHNHTHRLGISLRMNGVLAVDNPVVTGGQGKRHPQDYRATVLNLGTTYHTLWTTIGTPTRELPMLSTIHKTYHHCHLSKATSTSNWGRSVEDGHSTTKGAQR